VPPVPLPFPRVRERERLFPRLHKSIYFFVLCLFPRLLLSLETGLLAQAMLEADGRGHEHGATMIVNDWYSYSITAAGRVQVVQCGPSQ
jgi:hypothetical protein